MTCSQVPQGRSGDTAGADGSRLPGQPGLDQRWQSRQSPWPGTPSAGEKRLPKWSESPTKADGGAEVSPRAEAKHPDSREMPCDALVASSPERSTGAAERRRACGGTLKV